MRAMRNTIVNFCAQVVGGRAGFYHCQNMLRVQTARARGLDQTERACSPPAAVAALAEMPGRKWSLFSRIPFGNSRAFFKSYAFWQAMKPPSFPAKLVGLVGRIPAGRPQQGVLIVASVL
jgi:hypothetical protein